ncbi:MAG: hypothetical protein OXN18_12205 [Gemmatimonadota bacterium]|nr:hypothetical protein [Gemmatimonadota bacterium]
MTRSISQALRIAVPVALVVVTFGYAITGNHTDVLLGAGCGLAVGAGVGLRGSSRGGVWTGILIGLIVGVTAALLTGALAAGWGLIIPPLGPLALGLIDGLGKSSFTRYREVVREMFIVAVLLTLGLVPGLVAGNFSLTLLIAAYPLLGVLWSAMLVGLLCSRREGWRDPRPPRPLVLGAVALPVLMGLLFGFDVIREDVGLSGIAAALYVVLTLVFSLVAIPVVAFLLGRAGATWLRPRLAVYGQLADYLRVMWVPIGGFALGYMTIIGVFAGFYGTLERFHPGAFADAGSGITEWLSFAFFTALGQDYATVAPVSVAARVLVGVHLIFSAGWALVLFAAVMSSIRPKLDQISLLLQDKDGE